MSEHRRISDADLLAHLRRRLAKEAPGAAWSRAEFVAGVHSKIETENTSPPGRLAPAMAGLTVAVMAIFLIVVALPPAAQAPPASNSISATARQGDFILTITASRPEYRGGDPIDVEAVFEYQGPKPAVGLSGATQLIGFGIEQQGGSIRNGPVWRTACKPYLVQRGVPIETQFTKSGDFSESEPDAAFWRAYFGDPVLRLPAGTWRVFVVAQYGTEGCGSSTELTASIVLQVQPAERVVPADAEAPRIYDPVDFATALRAGRLTGSTVVVAGSIPVAAGPLTGRDCEGQDQLCTFGDLDGVAPPVEVFARQTPELVGEDFPGGNTRGSDDTEWPWLFRPRPPVEGNLILAITADDKVEFLGRLRESPTRSITDVSALQLDSVALDEVILVDGWLTGIGGMRACELDGVNVEHGLPQRYCGNDAWIVDHPHGFAFEGIRVQNHAYYAFAADATAHQADLTVVEPRWGTYALTRRLEGWCGPNEPPCWQWHVVGRLASSEPISQTSTPTPAVPPIAPRTVECNRMVDFPEPQPSPGGPVILVTDETGLVESCGSWIGGFDGPALDGPAVVVDLGTDPAPGLIITWLGTRCDTQVDFMFRPVSGSYELSAEPAVTDCDARQARYGMHLDFTEPVPRDLIEARVAGVPATTPATPAPTPSDTARPGSTPPSVDEQRATARQVLEDWATFVDGAPADTIVVSHSLTTQDHGWSGPNGDNAKSALMAGVIDAEVELPTDAPSPGVVSWPDGSTSTVELIAAADALDALRREGGGECGGCTPVHVTKVRLTTHEFDTTRGPTQLPSWEFTLREGRVHVYRVAAAHALVLHGEGWTEIESISTAPSGNAMAVHYLGGACTDPERLRAHAVESDTAVVVFVTTDQPPHSGPCIAVGIIYTLYVEIDGPLGSRTVLDIQGYPVTRDASWLRPR